MERTHFTIYEIRHNKSGKIYVGKHQTQDLSDNYFGSGKILKQAIKKYGHNAFTKTILFDFDTEAEMNAKEAELVTEDFCARKDTYNICEGGKGGFGYINKNNLGNQSLGAKITNSKWSDPEQRKRVSDGLKRYYTQPGVYAKRSKIHSDLWKRPEYREKQESRVHTKETRELLSEIAKQRNVVGSANGMFGKKWITDGSTNRCISKTDIIPIGWYFGRTL